MEEEAMTEWLKRLLGVKALELKVDQYKGARDRCNNERKMICTNQRLMPSFIPEPMNNPDM
jgi:hypothetical protein